MKAIFVSVPQSFMQSASFKSNSVQKSFWFVRFRTTLVTIGSSPFSVQPSISLGTPYTLGRIHSGRVCVGERLCEKIITQPRLTTSLGLYRFRVNCLTFHPYLIFVTFKETKYVVFSKVFLVKGPSRWCRCSPTRQCLQCQNIVSVCSGCQTVRLGCPRGSQTTGHNLFDATNRIWTILYLRVQLSVRNFCLCITWP